MRARQSTTSSSGERHVPTLVELSDQSSESDGEAEQESLQELAAEMVDLAPREWWETYAECVLWTVPFAFLYSGLSVFVPTSPNRCH